MKFGRELMCSWELQNKNEGKTKHFKQQHTRGTQNLSSEITDNATEQGKECYGEKKAPRFCVAVG